MDGKSLRTIATFGLVAIVALTLMMMFSLNQIADTQTPQIAAAISSDLARALAPSPPANVRLTMTRDGKGVDAARVYRLVVRPSEAVAANERSLERLMSRAAELCATQIEPCRADVFIECVAELADGARREARFARNRDGDAASVASIRAVAAAPGTQAK